MIMRLKMLHILICCLLAGYCAQAARVVLAKGERAMVTIENLDPENATAVYMCEELRSYLGRISGAYFRCLDSVCASQDSVLQAGNRPHPRIFLSYSDRAIEWCGVSRLQSGNEAYSITVKDGNLVLCGNSPRALTYAVYGFLERLGCRYLSPNYDFYQGAAEYVPTIRTLVYDGPATVTVAASLANRKIYIEEGLSHNQQNLLQLVEWMPKAGYNTLVAPINYQGTGRVMWDKMRGFLTPELQKRGITIEVGGHGYQNFVNASMHENRLYAEHPEWFGMDENGVRSKHPRYVVCTSEPGVVEYMINAVKVYLKAHPEINTFAFWPPDAARWCRCERCAAIGSDSQKHILLVNQVTEALSAEFPNIQLECLAYEAYLNPVREVTLSPSVMVDFCPIDQSYETQIYDSANEKNTMYAQAFQGWGECFSGEINLYSYYRKYAWKSLPMVLPHYIAADVRWYAANGVDGVSIYGEPGDWATYEVNHYVLGKLALNPSCDVDSLMHDFVNARYGRYATLALDVLNLFERLPRMGAAIPGTSLKTVEQYDIWLNEIEKASINVLHKSSGDNPNSRALERLVLSLKYLHGEFELRRAKAAGASTDDIHRIVQKIMRWGETNEERGIVISRNFTQERLLSRHKLTL